MQFRFVFELYQLPAIGLRNSKRVFQVTNCYSIPFRETPEGAPEINDLFNMQMWQVNKRATPSETVVGWCVCRSMFHS